MDRVATDVAKPPNAGGEQPSFEELLAKGSFHARLARARAEREKALTDAAGDDDFILDTRRKPWEKQEEAGESRDRLVQALRASAATEPGRKVVTPLRPDRRRHPGLDRTDRPRADVLLLRPNGLTPPVPTHSEPVNVGVAPRLRSGAASPLTGMMTPVQARNALPVAGPRRAGRRAFMVGSGFAAGLALGVAAAAILPQLLPTVPAVRLPPTAVAAAPVTPEMSLPDLETPRDVVARFSPVALDARVPPLRLDGSDARDAAPMRSASERVLGTELRPAQPALAFDAIDVPDIRAASQVAPLVTAAVLVPGATADAGPRFSVSAPRPIGIVDTVGRGGPDLPPFSIAAEVAALAYPVLPLLGRFEGTAMTYPAATTPADVPPVPQALPPAPGPLYSGPVVLNAPETVGDADLAGLVEALGAEGFVLAEPNRVGITISESNVRFFHPEDAAAAAAVADALGADPRDFTTFSPAPPAGTIEVWLAGRGDSVAPAKARRTSGQGAMTAADRELDALRNRILQQLRNGEHL